MKNLKDIKNYGTYTILENNIPYNIPRQLGKTISTIINIKNNLIREYKQRLLRIISVSKHRKKRGYKITSKH